MRRQILRLVGALPEVVGLFQNVRRWFPSIPGNADIGIGDGEGDVSGILCERAVQADFALCGVFLCIGKEVDEYLAHTLPVGAQFVAVVHFGGVVELHAFGRCGVQRWLWLPGRACCNCAALSSWCICCFPTRLRGDVPHQCKEEVGIVLYEMAEILPFLLGKVRVGEVMSCEKPTIELSGVRIS